MVPQPEHHAGIGFCAHGYEESSFGIQSAGEAAAINNWLCLQLEQGWQLGSSHFPIEPVELYNQVHMPQDATRVTGCTTSKESC